MTVSPPPAGRTTVLVVDPGRIGEPAMAAFLSPAEQEQAARFHFAKDARHWRACRAALRRILGETLALDPAAVPLRFGEHGKPALAPPWDRLHFNLSHCHDLALVALCTDGPVGVDLEPADRAAGLLGCEAVFLHPAEIAALPESPAARAAALLDLWTAKEALLKGVGTGMSLPPQSVTVASYLGDPRLRDFRLHRLSHPALERHVACVAVPASVKRTEILRFPA